MASDIKVVDLERDALIGSGAKSSVWRCHHRETGEEYALKVIPRASIVSAQQVAHVMSEKSVLKRSSIAACPFIVGLVSTDKDDENLYFVLELLTGGSLADHMRHIDLSSGYDWTLAVRFYLAEVLLALKAIHEEGCIYRDLKANNVVLSADGHAKLVDFGFAKELDAEGRTNTWCGTPHAMAPELVQRQVYTKAVDWWAFGVLVFELLARKRPFGGGPRGRVVVRKRGAVPSRAPPSEAAAGAGGGGTEPASGIEPSLAASICSGCDAVEWPAEIAPDSQAADLIRCVTPRTRNGAQAAARLLFVATSAMPASKLLDVDPSTRLGSRGAKEVMAHAWFTGIDWEKLAAVRCRQRRRSNVRTC